MRFFYDLIIQLYRLGVKLASYRSEKAASFLEGRKNWRERLKNELIDDEKRIWVHVASLGEYEQALPVLDKIHKELPDYKLILTFFSPSGYENAKLPAYLSNKFYLPFDTAKNAVDFLDLVNPALILFVKYDIWYHYLIEADKRNIPKILFSALYRKDQIYFQSYGKMMRKALKSFNKIFVQNRESGALLEKIGLKSEITGDTRFDRVKSRMENNQIHPVIRKFSENENILVVGSSWQDDLSVILDYINQQKDFKVIIAPHNIGKEEVQQVESQLRSGTILFSQTDENSDFREVKCLIIDNIGMLASVYAVADIAYVGGAFHGLLHNILEPAVFGIPVVFGPKHDKFPEAKAMIHSKAGFSVSDKYEFSDLMKKLSDGELRQKIGKNAAAFVDSNLGSSDKIMAGVRDLLSANK